MDRDVIERKLELLRRHVARIDSKQPFTRERLGRDEDLQDIVAHNLAQAVQVSVDIGMHLLSESSEELPESMGEVFERMAGLGILSSELGARMRAAVGFRNVAMHAYGQLDWAIAFDVCTTRLSDFRDYARAILRFLEQGAPGAA